MAPQSPASASRCRCTRRSTDGGAAGASLARPPPVTPTREVPASAASAATAATAATASAASAALEGVAAAAAALSPGVAPGPVAPDQWEGESQEGRALLPRGRRLLLPRAAWAA